MRGQSLLAGPIFLTLLLGLLTPFATLHAQSNFNPIAIPLEGLPSQSVYDLLVDAEGVLWMGTDAGLVRYDGTELVTYSNPGQGSRAATGLTTGAPGTLSFHNFSGDLFQFDGRKTKLTTAFAEEGMGRIQTMTRDGSGNLFVGTDKSLFLNTNGEWSDQLKEHGPDMAGINGLHVLAGEGDQVFLVGNFRKKNLVKSYPDRQVREIPRLHPGRVRMGETPLGNAILYENDDVLVLYDPDKPELDQEFIDIELPPSGAGIPNRYINLIPAGDHYWILTYNGAHRYHIEGKKFVLEQSIMQGYAISDLVVDIEGNTWVSTLGAGAYMIPSLEIRTRPTYRTPLRSHAVSRICRGNGEDLYIGGAAGVVARIDGSAEFRDSFSMPIGGLVETLIYDAQNDLHLMGVYNINVLTAGARKTKEAKLGILPKALLPLPDGRLLAGTIYGIYLVTPAKDLPASFEPLSTLHIPTQSAIRTYGDELVRLSTARVRDLAWDGDKAWIAATNGLFSLDPTNLSLQEMQRDGKPITARALACPDIGGMFVAPLGGGVLFQDNGEWIRIDEGTRLEPLAINCLLAHGEHLYIGSNGGLWTYSPNTRELNRIEKGDGLPSDEINDIAVNEQGIWLATGDGVAFVPEGMEGTNRNTPPVSVRKLAINELDTTVVTGYRLSHQQNSLKIDLGTVCYGAMGEYHFDYRLVGLDTNWLTLPNGMHEVRFPSLPPGDYRFEARAYNEDGIRSAAPATLQFSIVPAIWQRWWFLPAISLAVLGLILYGLWVRFRVLRKQDRLVTERAEARLQVEKSERARRQSQLSALRSQMNPHFIYNMLNTLQSFILNNEKRKANQYLGHFSTLMRMALEFSRQESILLAEEVELLEAYLELEAPRFGDEFSWQVKIAPDIDPQTEEVPPLIIQPFVENAIKHGLLHRKGERRLRVEVAPDPAGDFLEIVIEDNGVGREKAREINERKPGRGQRRSFATAAARERLDLINEFNSEKIGMEVEDLCDASGTGIGTRVSLRLPRLLSEE